MKRDSPEPLLRDLESFALKRLQSYEIALDIKPPVTAKQIAVIKKDIRALYFSARPLRLKHPDAESCLTTLQSVARCRRAITRNDASAAAHHAILSFQALSGDWQRGEKVYRGVLLSVELRKDRSTADRDKRLAREFLALKRRHPAAHAVNHLKDQIAERAGLKSGHGSQGRKAIDRGLTLLAKK